MQRTLALALLFGFSTACFSDPGTSNSSGGIDTGDETGTSGTTSGETSGATSSTGSESGTTGSGTTGSESGTGEPMPDVGNPGPDPIEPGEPCHPIHDVCTEDHVCWFAPGTEDPNNPGTLLPPTWTCEYHPVPPLEYGEGPCSGNQCYAVGVCMSQGLFSINQCANAFCCTQWCETEFPDCAPGMSCIIPDPSWESIGLGYCQVL